MEVFPPTIVIRHRLENLKKCTLRGLELRSDFLFFRYPIPSSDPFPSLENYIILALDAPPLSEKDAGCGLLIVDATWRYAAKMLKAIESPALVKRSLPSHYRTAYPRRQADCSDPERGLASIEALFLSYLLLERDTNGLLDLYHWKELFLLKNQITN